MRYVQFEYKGRRQAGVYTQDGAKIMPLSEILKGGEGGKTSSLMAFIRNHTPNDIEILQEAAKGSGGIAANEITVLAPIEQPIHDILCAGLNYQDHIAEFERSALEQKAETAYFGKRAIRILGTGDTIAGRFDLDTHLDYEVELAVIMGKGGRDIPAKDAFNYIFGYCVFNDLSARQIQRKHSQWYRGKSLDSYTAMGPIIVGKEELTYPLELDIECRVNNQIRQSANTRQMIKPISAIIKELSAGMMLEAGDIIATGTPSGVAMGREDTPYLKSGDTVVCEIEGIGKLENTVGAYQLQ